MQSLLRRTHDLLLLHEKTVAVAESCTGGLLAAALTSLPDSSAYFLMGLTAYSNRSKTVLLGVPASLIASKGAVSHEVARFLARRVRQRAHADFGIGITGIAGPGGAVAGKPVGTIYIGFSDTRSTTTMLCRFHGSRSRIREQAVRRALEMLTKGLRRSCAHLSPLPSRKRSKKD